MKSRACFSTVSRNMCTCTHGRRKDFFQGAHKGIFPKFFQGGPKSGEICFLPLENKKTTFFCKNFQNPGGNLPPLPTPMHAHRRDTHIFQFYLFIDIVYKVSFIILVVVRRAVESDRLRPSAAFVHNSFQTSSLTLLALPKNAKTCFETMYMLVFCKT